MPGTMLNALDAFSSKQPFEESILPVTSPRSTTRKWQSRKYGSAWLQALHAATLKSQCRMTGDV